MDRTVCSVDCVQRMLHRDLYIPLKGEKVAVKALQTVYKLTLESMMM